VIVVIRVLPILFLFIAATAGAQTVGRSGGFSGTYWNDWERGWHWYEDPPEEPKARPAPKGKAVSPEPKRAAERVRKAPELVAFEALQKRMEELQHIAYMNPTEENVRNYLEMQAFVVEKSSYFADVWQRVVWATPDLDYTVTGRPVNAKALEVFNDETQRERAQTVSALSKSHVLFFFFRSDCPYCHMFAPYLREFEAKFGLKIEAVSLDGGPLPEFPRPRIDNGIARTLDVKHVPALYLADPAAGRITPIGFGVLSEGELLERIQVVTRPDAESMVPSASKRVSLR
jgi:conjugal transfer pilus assembly protein TraF